MRRPVYVAFNAGSMIYSACPGSASASSSSVGLTAEEILDMSLIAGADPNVSTSTVQYVRRWIFLFF